MADQNDTPQEPEGQEPEAARPEGTEVELTPESPEAADAPDAPVAQPEVEATLETVVDEDDEEVPVAPRVKPAIPGADLEVDIVLEGDDARPRYSEDGDDELEAEPAADEDEIVSEPIAAVEIDLGVNARYRATGKRKSAVARVTLKPGTGAYLINGRDLATYFPREALQRNIRQPLEAVGYEDRMDVVARIHGGGVAAQGGALRHGISRALLEADPNLRLELKRRGFLTRDSRVKERKKAGLKKARKRPQFSKR
jgi:small subunit ribosomal protein S9